MSTHEHTQGVDARQESASGCWCVWGPTGGGGERRPGAAEQDTGSPAPFLWPPHFADTEQICSTSQEGTHRTGRVGFLPPREHCSPAAQSAMSRQWYAVPQGPHLPPQSQSTSSASCTPLRQDSRAAVEGVGVAEGGLDRLGRRDRDREVDLELQVHTRHMHAPCATGHTTQVELLKHVG
jgi:hypothetical protein